MIQLLVHYGLHFVGPLIVSLLFFRNRWKKAYVIMLLGLLIDLDHLIASPVFEPNRCSINFHPLHTYYAIAVYIAMVCYKRTRLIGLGLVIHVVADMIDCWMMP